MSTIVSEGWDNQALPACPVTASPDQSRHAHQAWNGMFVEPPLAGGNMPEMNRPADDSLDPALASLVGHDAVPDGIAEAVRKPAGARFYKCALQVNLFA